MTKEFKIETEEKEGEERGGKKEEGRRADDQHE
jgi:hypothetical protein